MHASNVTPIKRPISAEEFSADLARLERIEKLYIAAQAVKTAKRGLDLVKSRNKISLKVAEEAVAKAMDSLDVLLAEGRAS